jgi:hypothetical protein
MFRRNSKQQPKSNKSYRSPSVPPPPLHTPPLHTPPLQPQQNGNSFKDSILSGFGFGIGSSIAHKMSDSIFISNNKTEKTTNEKKTNDNPTEINNICDELKIKLEKCVTESNIDCKPVYDDFFSNCK